MKKMEQETEFARIHQIGLPAILVTGTGNHGKIETHITTVEPADVRVNGSDDGDHAYDRKSEGEREGKTPCYLIGHG